MLVASIHADNPGRKTPTPEDIPVTVLRAGVTHKKFPVPTHLLTGKVPFFKKLLSTTPSPTEDQLTFDDFDEFSFALLSRWLHGGKLQGPYDFHSVQHYLGLYVIGQTWDIEALCNDSKYTSRSIEYAPTDN
jgi:hypothetical protein